MSEETPPAVPPAAPAATPPAAPQVPTAEVVSMTSKQLQDRLAEQSETGQRKLLKSLGFEKPEDLQASLKKLKDIEDAGKSESERLNARIKELEPLAAETPALRTALDLMVKDQFDALPENIRNAIDGVAKGDASKRLEQMRVFRASGLLGAAPPAAAPGATPPATPPTVTPPARVTPSPAPPPSGAPTAFQKWEDMQKVSPLAADIYFQSHEREIEQTRPAQA